MPTGQPGVNQSASGLMSLPLEFRIVLLIAGAFVVLSLGMSQIVQGQGGHQPPAWARRYGHLAEAVTSLLAVITTLVAALFAVLADLDPEYGPIVLLVVAILPGIIGIRSFIALGRQRAWIWTIRKGDHLQGRFMIAFVALVVLIVAASILHLMMVK